MNNWVNQTDDSPYRITAWNSALTEQEEDQFAGVHSGVRIGKRDDGCDECDAENFSDWELTQLAVLTVLAPVNVCLNEKRADASAHDSQTDEWNQLNEDPRLVVLDEEQHRVFVAERVDGTEDESSDERTKERSPKCLQRKVIRNFLQAEEHTTYGRSESNRNTSSRSRW